MALRRSSLTEDWTPSRGARDRIAAQIRIQMSAAAAADSAVRQVLDNLRD
jgi:hypothetical protein